MVGSGVGNGNLLGVRIKIRVTDLDGDAAGQLALLAQFKSNFFGHGNQQTIQPYNIGSIGGEGLFGADGFLFGVRHYRRGIDAVGFLPDAQAA